MTTPSFERPRATFVGVVEREGSLAWVRDPYAPENTLRAALEEVGALADGDVVHVRASHDRDGRYRVLAVLAPAGSAKALMYGIAARHGLDPTFPPPVLAEVEALVAAPGIDDEALIDLTQKAFLTIDNEDSRDLDQALCIERDAATNGFIVWYALADAAHFVPAGSALFEEALRRGASYYLPGVVVPMLPEALSEGLVSLNEGVPRRALVLRMEVGDDGECRMTTVLRGRIVSRRKLTYDGVQAYHDQVAAGRGHEDGVHHGQDFTTTLLLLREVGERRIQRASERDVAQYQRRPVRVGFGESEGLTFTLVDDARNDVERWNEQISLLCNVEGAKLLQRARGGDEVPSPNVQAVFRAHAPPADGRVRELERFIHDLVDARGLSKEWRWRARHESLATYLARLPDESDGDGARVAQAIHRQAMVINNRSFFQDRPEPHHGVGADVYARFSSPMREIVGVFTHKEALEALAGLAHEAAGDDDVALQAAVIEAGNRAKALQGQITKEANKLAIDALLAPDLEHPEETRPLREGVVLGVTVTKVYVQLASPPVELKIYLDEVTARAGGRFTTDESEVTLFEDDDALCVVGDRVQLRVVGYDDERERWRLDLLRP